MDTASGARWLSFRLKNALLSKELATVDRPTGFSERMAAQVNGSSFLFTSSCNRNVFPGCLGYFHRTQPPENTTPCSPQGHPKSERPAYQNRDPLERKPPRPSEKPPQDLCGEARSRFRSDPHAPVISPTATCTQPFTTTYVRGSEAFPGMVTFLSHTDLLSSSIYQPPIPLFTPQILPVLQHFFPTCLFFFSAKAVSPYP